MRVRAQGVYVLRGCKMISLNIYKGKSWVLLGFFLLVGSVPLMRTTKHSSLDATTLSNEYSVLGVATPSAYYPSSNYAAFPIDPTIIGMANRNTPLSNAKDLLFHPNGTLELSGSDKNQNSPWNIWYNFADNALRMDFASAKLQNLGKLELQNINGTEAWKSFDYSPPTDMPLLRGQSMQRSQCYDLFSWQEIGNQEIANITMLLFGTDRISYLGNLNVKKPALVPVTKKDNKRVKILASQNQTFDKLAEPSAAKKDNKWVKILASIVGILGVLLIIVVAIFCLRRYEKIRQWLWACVRCGLCYRRPKPHYEIRFPGDTPARIELEDGGVELEMEERGPRCHCAVACVMSFR